ncbi:MAG: TetR/AcrR family transcriptional regulator [Firmicutes bacterium]|nr:TetR/AcrR family transcriptional regulator [Bacillota bacterium]
MRNRVYKKRPYLRSRITQRLIIETAEKVFLEYGYSKATITRISQEANVGYGTVYSHFRGKEDLMNRVVDRAMENFNSLLNIDKPINNLEDLKETFRDKIHATLVMADAQRPLFKVLQKSLGQSEAVFEHWENIIDHFIARIRRDLEKGREIGLVSRNLDLQLSAKAIILMLESFLWEIVHNRESELDPLTDTLTELFIQGLSEREKSPMFKILS